MAPITFLATLIISSYHIIVVLSCDPLIFYPEISNLQRLSSSENEILLTIQPSENDDSICILFDLTDNSFGDNSVECSSYSSDILSFTSDQDITSTTINSIDETLGISITRNSETFNIEWNELTNISNHTTPSSYISSDIESLTINDPFITFIRISNQLFAILFNSDVDNEYIIYPADSSIDFNLLTTKIYSNYNILSFIDVSDSCDTNYLYIYDIVYKIDHNEYLLNLTYVENDWNIDVDERNGFAYFWGYSSTFTIYDPGYDALYVNRYNAIDYSDIINGSNTNTNKAITFSYNITCILIIIAVHLFNV